MTLVKTSDFGVEGINYYFVRREMYNLSLEELRYAGVNDQFAYVEQSIIQPLVEAQDQLIKKGFKIIVKDSHRSKALYNLIYIKRVAKFGKEETDKTLNVVNMPHASGRSVDVNLLSLENGKELDLRDKQDGTQAFFVDYYELNTSHPKASEFNILQKVLAEAMLQAGFKFGSKKEFWHFEYDS